MADGLCGLYDGCTNPTRPGQRSCRPCHARWMRENRPKGPELSQESRIRKNARNIAAYALRSGKLKPSPCPCGCGKRKLEMHHEDYTKPLEVVFCCRDEHQRLDNARFARIRAAQDTAALLTSTL